MFWNKFYCAFGPTLAFNVQVSCATQLNSPKKQSSSSLLCQWGNLWHFPQQRLPPGLRLWGCLHAFGYISQYRHHISHGSTSTLLALPKTMTTSLDKTSAGFPWLRTRLIQLGWLNSASILRMTSMRRSLPPLADQLVRKDPSTASLSVKGTPEQGLIISRQLLGAPRTAIISSSWMMVHWLLDTMVSNAVSSWLCSANHQTPRHHMYLLYTPANAHDWKTCLVFQKFCLKYHNCKGSTHYTRR